MIINTYYLLYFMILMLFQDCKSQIINNTQTELNFLTNYWSFDNTLKDFIAGANGTNSFSTNFINDRNNNSNSAISLNNGSFQLPSGIYLNGNFTVSVWIKVNTFNSWSRLIDFANSKDQSDNLYVAISSDILGAPYIRIFNSISFDLPFRLISNTSLKLNQWQHLAFTLCNNLGSLYIDGCLVNQGPLLSTRGVITSSNYVGKKNFNGNEFLDASIDELKFFNKSLEQNEIEIIANSMLKNYFTTSTTTSFNEFLYLKYYWPFDNDLSEKISDANMYEGFQFSFVNDRYGNDLSAIYINNGYVSIPTIYLTSDYTISAWINVIFYNGNDRMLVLQELIYFSLAQSNQYPFFNYQNGEQASNISLGLKKWHHISFIQSGTVLTIIIDNTITYQGYTTKINSSYWISNRIGNICIKESFCPNVIIDDLKIFNKALNLEEISIISRSTTYYTPFSEKLYLNYHWPFDNNYDDMISGVKLYGMSNILFNDDRFLNKSASVYLNFGYISIPSIYINTDFSICAWVYLRSYQSLSRLLALMEPTPALYFSLVNMIPKTNPYFSSQNGDQIANSSLLLEKWQHVAFTQYKYTVTIYIDFLVVYQGFANITESKYFTKNYIGQPCLNNLLLCPNVKIDDLKIFNKSLSLDELKIVAGPIVITQINTSSEPPKTALVQTTNSIDTYISNNDKFEELSYLTYYWSFDGHINESFARANINGGFGYSFVRDRFNNLSSAIYFKNGTIDIDSIKITKNFTIAAWVYMKTLTCKVGIIHLNLDIDSIIAGLTTGNDMPYLYYFNNLNIFMSNIMLKLNQWQHVSFTNNNLDIKIYIDGELVYETYLNKEHIIGSYRGNKIGNKDCSDYIVDELKIFNRSLLIDEINMIANLNEMQTTLSNGEISQAQTKSSSLLFDERLYLTNYWPFDENYLDAITGLDLSNGIRYSLANDRFNNKTSALYLNYGYRIITPSVSINKEYTITAWVNLSSYNSYGKLLLFGKDPSFANRLVVSLTGSFPDKRPYILTSFPINSILNSNYFLPLNEWHFIAYTQNNSSLKIYINGTLASETNSFTIMNKTIFPVVYIGQTCSATNDSCPNALIDELKIFNKSLNIDEILYVSKSRPTSFSDTQNIQTTTEITTNKAIPQTELLLNSITTFKILTTPSEITTKKSNLTSFNEILYLAYFWSFSANLNDEVDSNLLYGGVSTSLTLDRFNYPSSALLVDNNGYIKLPEGVYFKNDFTISLWIKINSINQELVILDFGNTASSPSSSISNSDNVVLKLDKDGKPILEIYNNQVQSFLNNSQTKLQVGKWQYLSATLLNDQASIYIDTVLISTNKLSKVRPIIRDSNFIGKSNTAQPRAFVYPQSVGIKLSELGKSDYETRYNDSFFPLRKKRQSSENAVNSFIIDELKILNTSLLPENLILIRDLTDQNPAVTDLTTSPAIIPINIAAALPLNAINDILSSNSTNDITSCLSNCSNNGYCVKNNLNQYVCSCFQYYSGQSCEVNLNPCKKKKQICLNNSTCELIDLTNSNYDFVCNCQNLYYGRYCEKRINVCENETCSLNGVCYDIFDKPSCKCFVGYSGLKCQIKSEELVAKQKAVTASTIIAIIVIISFYLIILFLDFLKYFIMGERFI